MHRLANFAESFGIQKSRCLVCLAEKARDFAAGAIAEMSAYHKNYVARLAAIRRETCFPRESLLARCREISGKIDRILRKTTDMRIPETPCKFRWATEREAQRQVGPPGVYFEHPLRPGDRGVVVVPQNLPPEFNCLAALWTLVSHEARPGHEYRFSETGGTHTSPLEDEGWAVYALSQIRSHFPPDAWLFSMQIALLEAAKCFLEVEFHRGTRNGASVRRYLVETVGISPEYAERTFRRMVDTPGQGLCYFAGYLDCLRVYN